MKAPPRSGNAMADQRAASWLEWNTRDDPAICVVAEVAARVREVVEDLDTVPGRRRSFLEGGLALRAEPLSLLSSAEASPTSGSSRLDSGCIVHWRSTPAASAALTAKTDAGGGETFPPLPWARACSR